MSLSKICCCPTTPDPACPFHGKEAADSANEAAFALNTTAAPAVVPLDQHHREVLSACSEQAESADFEEGYDHCVKVARDALTDSKASR